MSTVQNTDQIKQPPKAKNPQSSEPSTLPAPVKYQKIAHNGQSKPPNKKTGSVPILVVITAMAVFLILSGLAVYAQINDSASGGGSNTADQSQNLLIN